MWGKANVCKGFGFFKKMAYTTLSNIIHDSDNETIIQLTDDNDTGSLDNAVVNKHISKQQNIIDGYLRGRYPVEMADEDVPELIEDACTKMVLYSLYGRRATLTMPEKVTRDYKDTLKFLISIQKAEISPFETEDEPEVIIKNKTSSDQIYTSSVWATYH